MFNSKSAIYFYCDPSQDDQLGRRFQHLLICLAEGLQELEIPFFSNVNYWQESPEKNDYLFRHSPEVIPDDCSIVVLTNNWFNNNYSLPENLFHPKRQYITVYLDGNDADKTYSERPEFRKFDFIFKTHFNQKLNYGYNFYPWAFGLSNRILQELREVPSFENRNKQILINFRAWKKGHPVRNIGCNSIMPHIRELMEINNSIDSPNNYSKEPYHILHWKQTGSRHYPTYYQRLKNSTACACFGGFFVPSWPDNPSHLMNRCIKQLLAHTRLKSQIIVQWDSWRLWESLAAGCATFHVDFEKYGLTLPVQPKNWQHYIGVDLDNIKPAIERIFYEPEILEKVAIEGRNWVLNHYTPVPTAIRLLETIYQRKFTEDLPLQTILSV